MVETDFAPVIAEFISGFVDFVSVLFNFIYPFLAWIDLILILRVIFLIFFLVYFYRIIRDFFIFSGTTSFVIAAGLIAILELTSGFFGYLANIFLGLFLFIGGLTAGVVAILVGLIVLLMFYYFLARIGWRSRKEKEKEEEVKERLEEEKGKAFLKGVSSAKELAEKATMWGTLKHVAKKVPIIGGRKRHAKRGAGGKFAKK